MPIYEYKCGACGEEHDILQKMSADPLTTCPTCHKEALERLVSASSFALKGGGWYADGYGDKKAGAAKTPPATSSESKDTTKTKPDSTSKKTTTEKKKTSSDSSKSSD